VRRCYRFMVAGYVVMPEHDAASTAQGSGAHPSKTAKGGATEVVVMQRLSQPPCSKKGVYGVGSIQQA
jgi:hypothetical protein